MRKGLLFVGAFIGLLIVSMMIPWFGERRVFETRSSAVGNEEPPYTFPREFLWGTATAAYQVESTQDDDWAAFERDVMAHGRFAQLAPGKAQPGHIHNLDQYSAEIRQKKTDYDQRFPEDLALAAAMKHNAYRFSISWSRLFPRADMTEPDPAGVAFYRRVFDELSRNHLTPFVTLFHFATPSWLWQEKDGKRGWERADALAHFERFVRAVILNYGSELHHVCTLNEPMVYVYSGYLEGVFPPLERRGDPRAVGSVIVSLLKAHALAYRLLKEEGKRRGQDIQVGYAHHTRAFEPYRNYAPLDRITARVIEQAFMWDFADAVQTGVLRMTSTDFREEIPGLRGTQDYLGINYYGRFYVKSDLFHPTKFEILMHDPAHSAEDRPNDVGWADYPRGFRVILERANQRYHLPIYVLENGTADAQDDDKARQRFIVEHVREMFLARSHGAEVRGYFHWSLLDNFEWAEGFDVRFGLIKVDYRNHFARSPRPSAALYTRIIENGINAELAQKYDLPR